VFNSAGLSAGVAIVLSSGIATALNQSSAYNGDTAAKASSTNQPQQLQLAQIQDVVVDTEPAGRASTSTNRDSTIPSVQGNTQTSSGVRFTCDFINGQYTVMYHPESQQSQSYAWATPSNMGDGWTPQRRCQAIAQRLESYRPEGLQEMRTGVKNGYNIICVTTGVSSDCASRIVLTVPPGQDPMLTRDRVFQNLTVADTGQRTEGVNTLVNGSNVTQVLNDLFKLGLPSGGVSNNTQARSQNINLRPFLDRYDGGTGAQLRNGVRTNVPARSNNRLNPGNFR
jgi:hypothetical protein